MHSLAAVLRQEAEQPVHRLVSGGIDHRAALPTYRDQVGHPEAIKMKGECVAQTESERFRYKAALRRPRPVTHPDYEVRYGIVAYRPPTVVAPNW